MTDVIVTGGTGFIGRHLLPRLRMEGHRVYPVGSESGDIAESATWMGLPGADVVVHLAARSFVPDSWIQPVEYIRVNLLGTVKALEFCKLHSAQFVFVSSYMYGEPALLPVPETAALSARNPYALSKKLAEEACNFYSDHLGVKITILRPFNVYGAGQHPSFLVPKIIAQVNAGETIRVMDLAPKRDYVYVKDLVEAINAVISSNSSGGIFNIGSGTSHSVDELILTIQGVLGTKLPIESKNERRLGEIMNTVADISTARHCLGWIPRFSLQEGLSDMLGRS